MDPSIMFEKDFMKRPDAHKIMNELLQDPENVAYVREVAETLLRLERELAKIQTNGPSSS